MGKMNVVDLAGSERVGMSGVEGEQLEEASCINASLSALGDVLNALSKFHKTAGKGRAKAPPHIPFRNSKLTHLLKDSLGGDCKTVMIATVRVSEDFYGQSLSTLRYASRARDIKNLPTMHDDANSDGKLRKAFDEINILKLQLKSTKEQFDELKGETPTVSCCPRPWSLRAL